MIGGQSAVTATELIPWYNWAYYPIVSCQCRSLDVNLESISEKRLQDKALFFIYKLATLE